MENKRTILWIHGFAGCPDNVHVKEMRKRYPEYEWYSIEVDHHAKASMEKIDAYIHEHDVSLVAGTSLGGYYAMCADFEGPKLVVNPATNPVCVLRQFVGRNTYRPGRPDGQTEFEFTEEMLNEFADLHYGNLYNVLCHYTAHDQVLGEDVKKDYEQMFYMLEMMDEKILPEHFMTFQYVKEMKQTLLHLIDRDSMGLHHNAYDYFGPSYQLLPENILQPVLILHSMTKGINYKKLLCEIETCIKEEYEKDKRMRDEPWSRNKERVRETLKLLFSERRFALRQMFTLTQESFDAFKTINDNLLDMYNRMVDKMAKLYSTWLTDEEEGWQNDCNVCGRIIVEQTMDDYPADDTGSDYEWMAERIEELESYKILENEFSGAHDKSCDRRQLGLEHDRPNVYFSLGGAKPFGDFLTCRAFRELQLETLYAPQDILRIKYFWCDVYLTHQRITNDKGELQ